MNTEEFKRKLTAILSADVEGYTRLMSQDEVGTIRILTTYREVMANLIKQYKGRVVDAPGDNLLAEFASVVDAVNCAVEIQRELAERNAELPTTRKMQFRIGVNLGDVVEEEERIYGDGVNIAARIESLAEAGGISISGTVYDQVQDKLGLEYEYLGEQEVKNISRSVRVYRVLFYPDARAQIDPASVDRMEHPLPEKPSIAVLPFENLSRDPEQEFFGDGLTEEIITALSKVPGLFVIARNSTLTYKDEPVKVQQVAEELGVQYVLEGSVRKGGDKIRITAQLIDALTGRHLWAERYDRDLKDIFALQDEITMKIITSLQVRLTEGEQARVYTKGTDNLEAYLKVLEGMKHILRMNKEGNVLAQQFFEEAIALDPEYAMAYRLLAGTHQMHVFFGSKSPKQSLARAIELAQKAIALDDSLASAHSLLGFLFTTLRQHDMGIDECERAVVIDPNSADAYTYLALSLHYGGRHEEAIPFFKKAMRLNPMNPSYYLWGLGTAYRHSGRYEEAIAVCKKAIHSEPDYLHAHSILASLYSLSGREEEARTAAAEVLRIDPNYSVDHLAETLPYKKRADLELVINSLRKAGLK
jgi:adenylate cyclase